MKLREPVPFSLVVSNDTVATVDLVLRGRTPTFDIRVADANGSAVWHRLHGEIIPAIVHVHSFVSDEKLELRAHWDQRTSEGDSVEPGAYTVRGALMLEDTELETAETELVIES